MKKLDGGDRTPREGPRDWGESSAQRQYKDPSAATTTAPVPSSYGQRFSEKEDVGWYTCFLQGKYYYHHNHNWYCNK